MYKLVEGPHIIGGMIVRREYRNRAKQRILLASYCRMGRQPCCDKVGLKKGPWTGDEDRKLANFILTHGQFCWRSVPKLSGLLRCGKSCRLRWINYLRPDLKRGLLSESEEKLVIDLHAQLGNRWSKIASHMPGRTDNEIKNQWNTHIKKKLREMGIDPLTHQPLLPPPPPHEQESCSKDISTIEQDPVLMNINVPLDSATEATSSISSSSSSTILDNGLQLAITQVANQLDVTDYHNVEQVLTYDDGFCLEDVLLVEPPEIITNDCGNNNNIDINLEFSPPANLSSSSSKGTNNLADDSANTNGGNDNTTLEAAEHERWWAPKLPTKEDQLMGLWADDDLGCWDLEVNDEFNCEIEMIAASLRSCLDDDDYSSRTCK